MFGTNLGQKFAQKFDPKFKTQKPTFSTLSLRDHNKEQHLKGPKHCCNVNITVEQCIVV
jgi:hypothetical protein